MKIEPLEITARGDREVVVRRGFDAPRELVWQCYTRPELLRRWYGLPDWTMIVCEIDLRVGGRWRFVTRSPDGYEMGSGGEYREIAAPARLVNTESYDDDWTGGEALATLALEEADGVTTATTTILYSSSEARDAVLQSPMATGMEIGFTRLEALLAAELAAR